MWSETGGKINNGNEGRLQVEGTVHGGGGRIQVDEIRDWQ